MHVIVKKNLSPTLNKYKRSEKSLLTGFIRMHKIYGGIGKNLRHGTLVLNIERKGIPEFQ